jgi:hypothetical protein
MPAIGAKGAAVFWLTGETLMTNQQVPLRTR